MEGYFFHLFSSGIFLRFKKQKIRLDEKSDYLWMVGAGAVLAIHWSSYMQSIQSSTVAVGTLTVSTFPVFVIFLEPYLFHEKLKKSDVFCTLMMLVGVFFIVTAFQMDNQLHTGSSVGTSECIYLCNIVTDESPFFQQISGNTGVAL